MYTGCHDQNREMNIVTNNQNRLKNLKSRLYSECTNCPKSVSRKGKKTLDPTLHSPAVAPSPPWPGTVPGSSSVLQSPCQLFCTMSLDAGTCPTLTSIYHCWLKHYQCLKSSGTWFKCWRGLYVFYHSTLWRSQVRSKSENPVNGITWLSLEVLSFNRIKN